MTGPSGTADVQAVTFGIGQEVFAVPVPMVREVIDYCAPFRIPNGPDHFMGLIDVRGQGIPVIDLRIRFGLPPAEPTAMTRILILEVPKNGRGLTIGLLIDKALNVSTFARTAIEHYDVDPAKIKVVPYGANLTIERTEAEFGLAF